MAGKYNEQQVREVLDNLKDIVKEAPNFSGDNRTTRLTLLDVKPEKAELIVAVLKDAWKGNTLNMTTHHDLVSNTLTVETPSPVMQAQLRAAMDRQSANLGQLTANVNASVAGLDSTIRSAPNAAPQAQPTPAVPQPAQPGRRP